MLARKLPGFGARLRTNTFLAWGVWGPLYMKSHLGMEQLSFLVPICILYHFVYAAVTQVRVGVVVLRFFRSVSSSLESEPFREANRFAIGR